MQYLWISIFCSVAVSILLKIAHKHHIGLAQAIAINYIIASLLTIYFLNPQIQSWQQMIAKDGWLFILLGGLLPSIFIVMGHSVATAGIARSDTAQRLSLFLPILASYLIFGETLTVNRLLALALASIALFCLLHKPKQKTSQSKTATWWLLGVWLGYGSIDILLKQLSQSNGIASNLLMIFIISASLMFTYLIIKRTTFRIQDIFSGILLGSLNFSNILFYLKAHQAYAHQPSLVFTSMNIGVIVFGTLVGASVFKEKISKTNIIGIVLAIFAMICLYLMT